MAKADRMGFRGMGLVVAALMLLPFLPTSAAESIDVPGVVRLEGPTVAQMESIDGIDAFVVPDLAKGILVKLDAPEPFSQVCYVTKSPFGALPHAPVVDDPQCRDEDHLSLEAQGASQGPRDYVATYIHPMEMGHMRATLQGRALQAEVLQTSLVSSRGSDGTSPGDPETDEGYFVTLNKPRVLLSGVADLHAAFTGCLKIHGLTVYTRSSSGARSYETGEPSSSGPIPRGPSWLYVCVHEATLTIKGQSPLVAASPSIEAATQGTLRSHGSPSEIAGDLSWQLSANGLGGVLNVGVRTMGAAQGTASPQASWLPLSAGLG